MVESKGIKIYINIHTQQSLTKVTIAMLIVHRFESIHKTNSLIKVKITKIYIFWNHYYPHIALKSRKPKLTEYKGQTSLQSSWVFNISLSKQKKYKTFNKIIDSRDTDRTQALTSTEISF